MNNSALKIILLVFIFINFSCDNNDDNCVGTTIAADFTLKVKLVSETGANLFNDSNFDVSLLKLSDPFSENIEIPFMHITENGESLITFNGVDIDSVNFEYAGVDNFFFGFSDIQLQIVNCVLEVLSYKALRANGDLFCDCSLGDILVIPLNL
ncbi:hypothetical protein [Lacinutrix sp.]|uniref:hypothetical protein n=1 Tax=Lacinutrix sp. TaxID=1937692 RepID=UPI0025BE9B8D|nr:hypothetical protein [Lacinutrix sp.]